jgi:hypothetical protein
MTPKPDVDFNLLTNTSAMGCKSWSLPAGPKYCVGFVKGENSPCHYCYAGGGRYAMPNVSDNQGLRYNWWCRESPIVKIWVLSDKINKMRNKYLRVFDSGDFQNNEDITTWHAIVTSCPTVKFWFSTKSWIKSRFRQALLDLNAEPNVVVRRSALYLDKPAGKHAIKTTAEVHTVGTGCPKQVWGSCKKANCRDCWDKDVLTVVYKLHGHKVHWK